MDPLFKVTLLAATQAPQTLVYKAMHQCYSSGFVAEETINYSESRCGELVVKHLLEGGRGHYGPLEHPQISFNVGYFPHSLMQQARTHRVGISFACQSFRYSGKQISDVFLGERTVEEVFYIRPTGEYSDRFGSKYSYTEEMREADLEFCEWAAAEYHKKVCNGMSEEHARGTIPFDIRQHFVVSFNARSLMHFLDLRAKKDAQLEIRQLCNLLIPHLQKWMPEVADWYCTNRLGKARLSP